jgi:hypothetical protein
LVKFTAIWYILCPFGVFFKVWFIAPKKNLATLIGSLVSLMMKQSTKELKLAVVVKQTSCIGKDF